MERLLGEGGMGSVYLSSRADGQFEQQVAIKLLAPYLRGELFTDRFRSERQALANLNHPNVTRILDSGVTAEGDPYLVMEYVDGLPIDVFCDEHRLTVQDRVKLFAQVCTAVDYADRKRIIHRDLKPSNILVSKEGTIKLLDFGTAKLLETVDSNTTQTRFRMMTPRYASAEQLRGEAVSELADVYSLGIVLYELLTGAWPFGDPASVVAGLERAIREVDAILPSRAITPASAEARSTSVPNLARIIDGDLANITLKATQADPQGRYQSVSELASDLGRYLAGKPIVARPRTMPYRAQRFLRRNKLVVTAAAFTMVAIAASIGVGVFFGRGTSQTGLPSIAVLPFTNHSSDPAEQYFSDGLTDEIIDSLARVKMLRVIARSSTFQFRGKAIDVREAGRLLNVSHVLEGTVERSGDTSGSSLISIVWRTGQSLGPTPMKGKAWI